MLNFFRQKGAMSFIYTLLMGAVMVVFVVQFRPNASSPTAGLLRKCVAKVRGTCVDEKDWRAQRYLLRGQYDAPSTNWNKAAVDSLVERTLLEQEAKRLGIRVSEDDVMNELVRWRVHVTVPVAMRPQARSLGVDPTGVRWTQFGTKENPFDQKVFDKVVNSTTGQNTTEFVDSQQQELVAARMIALVAERVKVGDAEAFEQFAHERATTTVQYAKFDPRFFAEHFVPTDKASLDKWIEAHKKEVDDKVAALPKDKPAQLFDAKVILVDAKKDTPAEKKAEAKKKAEGLLDKVKKGEDFAKLAKESSDDFLTKDKGGRLEWVNLAEQPAPVRDALAKAKAGEPLLVESDNGFHVLVLNAYFEGPAAVALPMYREARGEELAQEAAQRVSEALKGKLPVALDAALAPRVEEAKKSGKKDDEAKAFVVHEEQKNRLQKALEDVLVAMNGTAWQADDKRPRVELASPYTVSGQPIPLADDPSAIGKEVEKLTKEAPITAPIKSGKERYLVMLADRKPVTREEFDKEKTVYVGQMLAKKREDTIVNYVNSLRDTLNKDNFKVEERYTAGEGSKAAPGEAPPPMPEE
jgi:peptidyl-prolyl cis-trans isomerase D